jgi:hypothetical protein
VIRADQLERELIRFGFKVLEENPEFHIPTGYASQLKAPGFV